MEVVWNNLLDLLSYNPEAPMIFSSALFWGLFLIFISVYSMVRSSRWQKVLFVVAFSLYFYYKSSGWYFLLLIGTSIVDWSLSRVIVALERKWHRKLCLLGSILLSLSVLGFFKYANFFMFNWTELIGGNFQPLDIILPVGISFYTFQSISYIVDVYKGRVAPTRTWIDYMFFLSFFPALVAGPIVRADYFLPQIEKNHKATTVEVYWGLWLIILGVIKKALIADYISQYNDMVFGDPTHYSGFENMMAVIGYTMQIYCDFSGYSDMAIGIAMIMGFHLSKNFDFPYKSKNITEFWRRWHISLSSWLRDYVYIPLGGNRKGKFRTYLNNFLTMLIGGLWHGADWKFVFWGAMHGGGLIIHKLMSPVLKRVPDIWPVKAISWAITIAFVSYLWIYFRADSWEHSQLIIDIIRSDFSFDYIIPFSVARPEWLIMLVVIIGAHAMPSNWVDNLRRLFIRSPWVVKLMVFVVLVQLVVEFMNEDVAPFIYFQF